MMFLTRQTHVFLVISIFPLLTIHTRCQQVVQRGILFEDLRRGIKIVEPPMKTFRHEGQTLCAKLCIKHPKCLAINYCHPDNCLLFAQDAFSSNISFEKNSQCDYVGLKESHFPECKVGSVERDIKDDSLPNECKINQKRVDAEWSMWSQNIYLDTADEWKRYETRGCVEARHGGNNTFCSGSQQKILEWVKFVHEKTNQYDVAFSSCSGLGGRLFISLNGTQLQLEFFSTRLGTNCYWLGITTDDPTTWNTNNEGVANENIIWATGEPDNTGDQDKTKAGKQNNKMGIFDSNAQSGSSCCSVCQMPLGILTIP